MIEVLSVASEIYPLVKTGGLADVAGALPGALAPLGVRMRTLVPGYRPVMRVIGEASRLAEIGDLFGGPARLLGAERGGLDLIVLDAPHLFDRPGNPYLAGNGDDWPDNWKRFAALGWVGAEIGLGLVPGYTPEILHAHDWQAGLVPAYVKYGPSDRVRTVMTVHNLAFQGQFPADIFPRLRLPPHAFGEGLEYYGGVGFLKAGLQAADALTTVSPTYALEIRSAAFGMGLEGLLEYRRADLTGILNGIDTAVWDPATDPALKRCYDKHKTELRAVNKAALTTRFGLDDGEGPLFAVVSRLTWQKGMDILASSIDGLVADGGRLALLGSGDAGIEAAVRQAAHRHRGRVGAILGYDEELSHLIQGGADAILIPSRFEPCGLTQLYGLRYGCVPVVTRVGGLNDTIIDANLAAVEAGVATGIQFAPATERALAEAIGRAITLYGKPKVWSRMQRRGMRTQVSWRHRAEGYADLYAKLLGRRSDDHP